MTLGFHRPRENHQGRRPRQLLAAIAASFYHKASQEQETSGAQYHCLNVLTKMHNELIKKHNTHAPAQKIAAQINEYAEKLKYGLTNHQQHTPTLLGREASLQIRSATLGASFFR